MQKQISPVANLSVIFTCIQQAKSFHPANVFNKLKNEKNSEGQTNGYFRDEESIFELFHNFLLGLYYESFYGREQS